MALESQRRVRKGVHSECSGRVHDVSAKCHAAERCQLSRGLRSECLWDPHCQSWLICSSLCCAPAVGLSPLHYSECLSAPANPSPCVDGGAGKRSVPFLPVLGQKWMGEMRLLIFLLCTGSEIAVLLCTLSGREL